MEDRKVAAHQSYLPLVIDNRLYHDTRARLAYFLRACSTCDRAPLRSSRRVSA